MAIDIGTVIDSRWELVGYLATGGMADLYRGRDTRTDAMVAVKVLRHGVSHGERRFAGEVSVLRELDHPNIVSLVDAGEVTGLPYLVLDLVMGESLAGVLNAGSMPLSEVARMGAELAGALAFAHDRGITHRDVKPSNVIFDRDGSAKLADFGLALHGDSERFTSSDNAIGTASYIAPEQLTHRQEVGPAADIYALGLLLIESITGQRAFSGPTDEAALARLSRDPRIPADLDDGWTWLLRAMTARHPAARPDAATVADAIAEGPRAETTQPMAAAVPHGDATEPLAEAVASATAAGASPQIVGGSSQSADGSRSRRGAVVFIPRPRNRVLVSVSALSILAITAAFLFLAGSGDDGASNPGTDTGVEDTGMEDTGPGSQDDASAAETGDTNSGDTGSGDTGSGDTGSGDTDAGSGPARDRASGQRREPEGPEGSGPPVTRRR